MGHCWFDLRELVGELRFTMQLNIRTSTGARKSCKKGILEGLRKVETMKRRKRKMADRAAGVG